MRKKSTVTRAIDLLNETDSKEYKDFQKEIMSLANTNVGGRVTYFWFSKLREGLDKCYHQICLERGRNKLIIKELQKLHENHLV